MNLLILFQIYASFITLLLHQSNSGMGKKVEHAAVASEFPCSSRDPPWEDLSAALVFLYMFLNYPCLPVVVLFASNLLLNSCASVLSFPVNKVLVHFLLWVVWVFLLKWWTNINVVVDVMWNFFSVMFMRSGTSFFFFFLDCFLSFLFLFIFGGYKSLSLQLVVLPIIFLSCF